MKRIALAVALAACNVPLAHFTGGGSDSSIDTPADAEIPPGDFVWVRSLSQVSTQTITAGPAGIVTPGYLYSTATFEDTTLTSAGAADLVIASFAEKDAKTLYAVRHGNVGSEFGLLATLTPDGTPIVSGVTEGDATIDLGQGPMSGGGTPVEDGYIGAYGDGTAEWVQRIVGPGSDKFLGSALGPSSTVYGAGWFEDTTMFNGTMLTSAGGRDIILARFNDFTGAVDLTKQFGGVGREEVSGGGIASINTTNFVMSGFFDTAVSFGGTSAPLTATHGGLDMWIAQFDSTGAGIWAVTYGGPGDDRDDSVVLDANGDVYITGTYTTSISFGSIALTSAGSSDDFIAKLDGTNGSPIWAISFGSPGAENAGRIALDNNGHVAFAGGLAGALNGGPTLGGADGYVAEFSQKDGSLIWQHVFSTAGDDGGGGVVYGESGDLIASVGLGGAYDFGMPVIGDPNPLDVLIRIKP
jgi:hypothetical protein